jgi:hypothetical protein
LASDDEIRGRLVELFRQAVRKASVDRHIPDIAVVRQNTPPDEREAEAAEQNGAREVNGGVTQNGQTSKNTKALVKGAGAVVRSFCDASKIDNLLRPA